VAEEGSITVPARLTQDFVTSLPAGVIDLELDGLKLNINTDKYQSVINGVSADEFPVMPAISKGSEWSISAKTLKKGLQQAIFAASNDEARPTLTGVYIYSNDGELILVATDSYRLAEKQLIKTKEDVSLLVPASALQDLLRIVSDYEGDVGVVHDDQQVLFRVGEVELVARLIEGTYPDYKKLIPTKFATSATLNRSEFVNITKVSSLFARESAGSVTVRVDDKTNEVSIRSVASQLGENTASANAQVNGGGDITLNSRYLLDALHALSGDEVVIGFNGKLEPCVLKDKKAQDYQHIIMPLKS
jgi:DNA polymerase-3 subunit beta